MFTTERHPFKEQLDISVARLRFQVALLRGEPRQSSPRCYNLAISKRNLKHSILGVSTVFAGLSQESKRNLATYFWTGSVKIVNFRKQRTTDSQSQYSRQDDNHSSIACRGTMARRGTMAVAFIESPKYAIIHKIWFLVPRQPFFGTRAVPKPMCVLYKE